MHSCPVEEAVIDILREGVPVLQDVNTRCDRKLVLLLCIFLSLTDFKYDVGNRKYRTSLHIFYLLHVGLFGQVVL